MVLLWRPPAVTWKCPFPAGSPAFPVPGNTHRGVPSVPVCVEIGLCPLQPKGPKDISGSRLSHLPGSLSRSSSPGLAGRTLAHPLSPPGIPSATLPPSCQPARPCGLLPPDLPSFSGLPGTCSPGRAPEQLCPARPCSPTEPGDHSRRDRTQLGDTDSFLYGQGAGQPLWPTLRLPELTSCLPADTDSRWACSRYVGHFPAR